MHRHDSRLLRGCSPSLVVAALVAGCGAGRAFGRGESAARAGDWDAAVEHYRRAVQEDPDRADYQIALERAMINASIRHLDQARVLEARGQLEDALREYRRASEYDPTNRQIAGKVLEMERRLRDLAEAPRPQPTIQQLQQAARQSPEPLLNPASRDPIDVVFNNASLRDILNSMGMSAGINVTFERDYQDRQLHGAAARRHVRAGAEPDPGGEPAVLQGDQRAHDHGDPRQRAEARAVRGAGDPHVLHLARRRDRAGADPERHHPHPGARGGAADRREQDEQHDHRSRQRQHRRDHRADRRAERQPEGRGRHRRADPRGQPRARQAVRHRPVATTPSAACSRRRPIRAAPATTRRR